jgi:hypothetical protein
VRERGASGKTVVMMGLRGMGAFAATVALFVACGGSTSNGGNSGGASGTGASAGSGGNAASSGSGGNAATAGSGATGGVGASGGSGATGGAWFACDDTSQCTLFANNCCGGYCEAAALSQFTAVSSQYVSEYQAQNCTKDTACAGCISFPQPNYAAVCRAGQCLAIDISQSELSACANDSDCTLRWGSGCCEACTSPEPFPENGLTAVSKNANVTSALCGSAVPPCCAPAAYPPDAVAWCNSGHCAVTFLLGN